MTIIVRIGLILMMFLQVLNIVQQCTPSTVCPGSSYCDINQAYCVCDSGFIGNCSIQAPLISGTASSYIISANQQLIFSINPQKLNVYIQYTLQICTNVTSLSISVQLWEQSGYITNYTQANGITSLTAFTVGSSQCLTLLTPFIKLGQQPNGQNQMVILGINDTSSIRATISVSVSQQIVEGFIIEFYLIIGISTFIGILIILTIIYVICKRRRRNLRQNMQKKQSQYNDIQFFKDHMPIFNALQLGNERSICPICLQQIQSAEVVRRTPCNHVFHSNCIDSWCLKNLNCPVCRNQLTLQAFSQKTLRRNTQISKDIQNNTYDIKWEQVDLGNIQMAIGNKNQIQQRML